MAIRFRCEYCNQLMSIASRQAGSMVPCPGCARQVVVPLEDQPPVASGREATVDKASTSAAEPNQDPPADPSNLLSSTQQPASPVPNEVTPDTEDESGFRLRRAKSEFGEMDLTPMVDVTFLLLIFFMVTASFSLQKSIEVPRPDPDQDGASQSIQTPEDLQENSIIVRIDENDNITVDYEPVGDADNLADLLLDKRRIEQKGDLVIDADENATHGRVVEVNDAAVEADFQHIRLAVRDSSN